ncbi:MAG: HAD-IIIA family hydrolase [Chitinophagaceae bacterium]
MLPFEKIDKSWTLFLDRDGVINEEKYMDYVYHYLEFKFLDGVLKALKKLRPCFGRIVVVTNQRGVEKKLMTEEALTDLHQQMMRDIEENGCKIDALFYCTSLDDHHPDRKPQTGMAKLAKKRFPEIEFGKSIMIGNTVSDMMFGKNAGMYTVFVQTTNPDLPLPHPAVDLMVRDLPAFADRLSCF